MQKIKESCSTEVHGRGGVELVKPARELASSHPKPCATLKTPLESCQFAAPCWFSYEENSDRGQRSAFPSETTRFAPLTLAHKGLAFSCLVNERATLRPHRIWCLITRSSAPRYACARCGTLPGFPRQCPLPLACRLLPKGKKLVVILNQPNRRRVSTDWLNRVDGQLYGTQRSFAIPKRRVRDCHKGVQTWRIRHLTENVQLV